MSNQTHSRAAKGGQFGANGEWYEGGKFINTVAENGKRSKETKKATGKQEVEPYKWEVAPEGKRSLFGMMSGMEKFDRQTMQFTFNENMREEFATAEFIAIRMDRIAAFNRGERWT